MNARPLALLIGSLLFGGCAAALHWPDGTADPRRETTVGVYTVRPGDSLYAIALKYDLDARDLARWNRLGDGELIFPGQKLVLRADPSAKTPGTKPDFGVKSAPHSWLWPTQGVLAGRFRERSGVGKGVDIAGKEGDAVFAAAAGRVVYSGGGLIGYGNLIIVKHDERVLSAYGYNKALLVSEGDQVVAGQRIATMGIAPGRGPLLHFEIRVDGKPQDPLKYLPKK